MMLNAHRNIELDARANRLLLNPSRPQKNNHYRNFTVSKAKTDAEICQGERISMCVDIRNKRLK